MALLDNRRRYGKKSEPDYSKKYLTFTALESGTFTLTIPGNVSTGLLTSISYSTDNGASWTTTNNLPSQVVITTPTISAGKSVLWKGIGRKMSSSSADGYYSNFSSTGRFTVSGNLLSLLFGNSVFSNIRTITETYALAKIFFRCSKLEDALNLSLIATRLSENCYLAMFQYCTSLTTSPELPATTLAKNCYSTMFYGCTSLTTAPSVLPATTLVGYCYNNMFNSCTSLKTAPVLPATTLVERCYQNMFAGCAKLNYIKAMFTTTPGSSYTSNWVYNIAYRGTFVMNAAATWYITGSNGIPSGWTVQTASS